MGKWEHKKQTLKVRGQAPELKRLKLWPEGIWKREGDWASASARACWLLGAVGWLGEARGRGTKEEAAAGILMV